MFPRIARSHHLALKTALAEAEAAEPAQQPIAVIAMESTAREIDSAVVLRGQTQADRQVEVRAETSAVVISEPLRKGSFVENGAVLCELDPGTRQASLDEARARLTEDGTWRDPRSLRQCLQPVLGDDESAPWAVMCGSGVTACHLAISGLLAGYSEPRVYVGSWSEWIREPSRPIGSGDGQ